MFKKSDVCEVVHSVILKQQLDPCFSEKCVRKRGVGLKCIENSESESTDLCSDSLMLYLIFEQQKNNCKKFEKLSEKVQNSCERKLEKFGDLFF